MRYLLLLPVLLLSACVGGSPYSAESGARATLDAANSNKQATAQERINREVEQRVSAAQTRGASEAEILLLRARGEATLSAYEISQAQASATEQASSYRRTEAALDRLGTIEAGGLALQATQTHAAATVTAQYIERKASVGMAMDITQAIAWGALALFIAILAWQLPPALRRYVDRKGSLQSTREFPVAWEVLPDGRIKAMPLYLPAGNGGNGHRDPPIIHNWTAPPAQGAPVLQGEVVTAQDVILEKTLRLIRDSIAANGEESQDVLGWRDIGMSSATWQRIIRRLEQAGFVDTIPGQGTRTHADTKLGDVLYTLEANPGELYAPPPPD